MSRQTLALDKIQEHYEGSIRKALSEAIVAAAGSRAIQADRAMDSVGEALVYLEVLHDAEQIGYLSVEV